MGLFACENLRFKIDWASLIVGRKFTLFALFYFVFEGGSFQVQAPRGSLYLEERFNGGFFALRVWGPSIQKGLYGGAYFQNFTVLYFRSVLLADSSTLRVICIIKN